MKTEDKMNVELELAGYKCRIVYILTKLAYPPFNAEDEFLVMVEFEKPYPAAIISTAIRIPVKDYSKEEFIKVVKKNGDEQIAASLEDHEQERLKREAAKQRTSELENIAHGIESKFK